MPIYFAPDYENERNQTSLARNKAVSDALQAIGQFMQNKQKIGQEERELQARIPYYRQQANLANAQARYYRDNRGMQSMVPVISGFDPNTGQPIISGNVQRGAIFDPALKAQQQFDQYKQRRDYLVNNPLLDQDTKGAVAAYDYSIPRLERVSKALSSIGEKDFGQIVKQIQIGSNNDLIVPDGSPLEDLVGAINDIRLTGFGLGGKNFTENEAKIVFGRLNPVGKSLGRYIKDINSLPDFFKAKINAGTGGSKFSKSVASKENPLSGSDSIDYDSLLKEAGI